MDYPERSFNLDKIPLKTKTVEELKALVDNGIPLSPEYTDSDYYTVDDVLKIKGIVYDEYKGTYKVTTENMCIIHAYPWDYRNLEPFDINTVVEKEKIFTLHKWAFYGFFKPTMDEVYRQLTPEQRKWVTHYHVDGPDDADALDASGYAVDKGYHLAITTLYAAK